jgi:hypothetical protein
VKPETLALVGSLLAVYHKYQLLWNWDGYPDHFGYWEGYLAKETPYWAAGETPCHAGIGKAPLLYVQAVQIDWECSAT